jgi:hypothetical protein
VGEGLACCEAMALGEELEPGSASRAPAGLPRPSRRPTRRAESVRVLQGPVRSLKNRWILVLPILELVDLFLMSTNPPGKDNHYGEEGAEDRDGLPHARPPSRGVVRYQDRSKRRVLAHALVDLEHVERRLRERLDALGPAPRAELLHVLMLPDLERADWIGEFGSYPESRAVCLRLEWLSQTPRGQRAGAEGVDKR